MKSLRSLLSRCVGLVITLLLVSSVGMAQEARVAIPSSARQAEIRKLLDDTFGLSKATGSARKQEVIKALLDVAADKATPKDDLYVVMQTALPLIKDVSDFSQLQTVVDQLTETFAVDADAERSKHILEFLIACKTQSALEPVLPDVLTMVEDATRQNQFDEARQLLAAADKAAKRAMPKNVPKSLTEARKVILEREIGFKSQTDARKTLATTPDDPKANLVVGQWLAVHEENWAQALPYLAKGSDAKWKAAASAELKDPKEAESQLAVADAWWDVAQASSGAAKVAARHYASNWYESVERNLTSPLTKAKVTQRQKELAASLEANEGRFGVRRSSSTQSRTPQGGGELPIGMPIDLLEMVKLPDHAVAGTWKRQNGNLICEPSVDARFMLPVVIRGSYELNCEFTRRTSDEGIMIVFPVGFGTCALTLSALNGAGHCLWALDRLDVKTIPLSSGAVFRPGTLNNGQRHRVHLEVTQVADQSEVTVTLNNVQFIFWKGNAERLTCPPNFSLPCPQALGVAAHISVTEVHKVELKLKRGGKGYRLGEDWKNLVAPVAVVPPREIAGKCMVWNGHKYFVSDLEMDFPTAQRLATQLQGRLLTISSAEEQTFILGQGRGRTFWMSGWRRTESTEWRDERNRQLRFIGTWAPPREPSRFYPEIHLVVRTTMAKDPGWHDYVPQIASHACIEWGEEYPDK